MTATMLQVAPWVDAMLDEEGHDPRGEYADVFWTAVLGPTTILLVRRLVGGLEREPAGFTAPVLETARMLGLGGRVSRNAAILRTLDRLVSFRLAHRPEPERLLVKRRLPDLTNRQLRRLPVALQHTHDTWREQSRGGDPAVLRERSRTLALTLLNVGETPEQVEAYLRQRRFHPAHTADALTWAKSRLQTDLTLP